MAFGAIDDESSSAEQHSAYPIWFLEFIDDRQTLKLSPHTIKAYRQDFLAIASRLVPVPSEMLVSDIEKSGMRVAFATYAVDHEAASIRRCWSTWNVLCTFLFTSELIHANPMPLIGRPKLAKSLPKALPPSSVEALVKNVGNQKVSPRKTDWNERDTAIILTAVLAGLRSEELRLLDVKDIRTISDGSAVLHVQGKGNMERAVPIEAGLLDVIRKYLESRRVRFPDSARSVARKAAADPLAGWKRSLPLFVGHDGERITRGTLQSRMRRAFNLAGPDAQRVPGALLHSLRHTYATELAKSDVSVYTLMKLLGHESMATSQRYVTAAGTETREAAAQNPLYHLADADGETKPF